MFTLYCALFTMLVVACIIIAIPFFKNQKRLLRYCFLTCLVVSIFAALLYVSTRDQAALKNWLTQGKEHYQLMEKFNELGGVDGAIHRIQEKLIANPQDAEGWLLLGKLYLGKQDREKAKSALQKAHDLQPNNVEISQLLEKP